MKTKLIILLGMFLLLTSFVGAKAAYVFKQSEDVTLCMDVFNSNNSEATASTTCNLTLKSPNMEIAVNDQGMTFDSPGLFCYDVSGTDLGILGDYPSTIRCGDGVDYAFTTFVIEVTPTGDVRGFGIFIVLILCSLTTFILATSLRIEWLGFLGGLLFLITGVYSMIYGIGDLADLYTRTIAIVSMGLGVVFMTAAAWAFTHTEED